MLKAIQLPAGIAHLDTGLADVDGNNLTHSEAFFSVENWSAHSKYTQVCLAIESLRLNSKTEISPSGYDERKSGAQVWSQVSGCGFCSAGSRWSRIAVQAENIFQDIF